MDIEKKKKKRVEWTTYYPYESNSASIHDMETLIPRHEILTVGKFNIVAYKHFEKLKNQPKN